MEDATDKSGKEPVALEDLEGLVGLEVGVSRWHDITQDVINRFAHATEDYNFIHVDPVRAAETPFKKTIAHGFLSLSMLSIFAYEALAMLKGRKMAVNHGFDSIRFVNAVPVDSRIRGRFTLKSINIRPSGYVQMTYEVTVDIENNQRPALVAEWHTIAIMEEGVVA